MIKINLSNFNLIFQENESFYFCLMKNQWNFWITELLIQILKIMN